MAEGKGPRKVVVVTVVVMVMMVVAAMVMLGMIMIQERIVFISGCLVWLFDVLSLARQRKRFGAALKRFLNTWSHSVTKPFTDGPIQESDKLLLPILAQGKAVGIAF